MNPLSAILRAFTRHLVRRAYLHPQSPQKTPRSVSHDVPAPFFHNRQGA